MITKTFTDTNILKQIKELAQKEFISKLLELFPSFKNNKPIELFLSNDFDIQDIFLEYVYDEIYEFKNIISAEYVPSFYSDDLLNVFIFDRTEIDECANNYLKDYHISNVSVSLCLSFGIERAIYDYLDEHHDDFIDYLQQERKQFIYFIIDSIYSKNSHLFDGLNDDFDERYEFIKNYITSNNITSLENLM